FAPPEAPWLGEALSKTHSEQASGIAAEIVTLEDSETLDDQLRAEEEDERQRNLGDHQRAARAAATGGRRVGLPQPALERTVEIAPQEGPGRRQTGEERDPQ